MLRRILMPLVLIALIVVSQLHAAQQPNVVLIISDDHAWSDDGFMGHEHVQTPRQDSEYAEPFEHPQRVQRLTHALEPWWNGGK